MKTPEQIQEAKDYLKGFGAWSGEEIAGWSDAEVQAMVVQNIAVRIREMEHFDTYEAFKKAAQQGSVSGEIYKGDDGELACVLSHPGAGYPLPRLLCWCGHVKTGANVPHRRGTG